ncbi:hypothetical protein AD006_29200 (plasmid) [Pseudonocardia sp. EC080610-09]|uniref:helix-turn-helix domain-containing protein n=1 Tax=unclassified Pseudonocardia TaxID=2619320 RepID=UPI0007068CD9|nr:MULTISPECIES: helix-turn-helix transcriptional regulator [unclassified Pseudonocardia]ALL79363.1 hypothetical protein AD006_29200 [Pseudonocardia sp. EC080610-09]ALL85335.1 hypothetical protein AD017_29590 [Pseudonocardia sp. EC080619-01]
MTTAQRVESALQAAGMSQREVAEISGLSQAMISRIVSGQRVAKVPELIVIALATGTPPEWLLGSSAVAERAESAARSTGSGSDAMRNRLLHFLELDAYLDDQAVFSQS